MSDELLVTVGHQSFRLGPAETLTFGRWDGCSVVLDTLDRGISRIAGSVGFDHGTWWVVNRSATRELHIVDALGLSVPLAVARAGTPASKRAVDPAGLRVLVTGDRCRHELVLSVVDPDLQSTISTPASVEMSTINPQPHLTIARKAALVAMVSGYLQLHPRHDPEPLNYSDIGKMLGLPASTVRRRIEAVRDQLIDNGVPGLQVPDARRPLAEWLLANRLVGPNDLAWLKSHIEAGPTAEKTNPGTVPPPGSGRIEPPTG